MSKPVDKTRVAIIGAGMSGLPLAQGLQKVSWHLLPLWIELTLHRSDSMSPFTRNKRA